MNTELRRKSKNDFAKHFFKVINNASFWKNHGKCEKHRDIKLSTTEARRNYLVSKANYQTNFVFLEIC